MGANGCKGKDKIYRQFFKIIRWVVIVSHLNRKRCRYRIKCTEKEICMDVKLRKINYNFEYNFNLKRYR